MPYSNKEIQKQYQREWHRNKVLRDKQEVVDILGGCCVKCGYNESIFALEVDHIVPIRRKKSGIEAGSELLRKILNGSIDTSKLQLLCANCHSIKTYDERILRGNHIVA